MKRAADVLHLWYVARPGQSRWAGTLRLVNRARAVSLQYADDWLAHGFAISEDLPLTGTEFFPAGRDEAAGAVEDARPDRWGERVIQAIEKPERLSLMEYLWFAGDQRFGAFSVSASSDRYEPYATDVLPALDEVGQIQELVHRVARNEPIPPQQRRLLAPGTSMGGARPKSAVLIDGRQWIVKFAEAGDAMDSGLIEHATMTLAARAGIAAAATQPIRLADSHAVAVRRFDRDGADRLVAQSGYVALRAEGSGFGYPELSQLLRRRGAPERSRDQMRELFRRMVFNILMDNTDDHERNHALLMDDRQHLNLAPAFDVLPTAQGLGYQQMRVGRGEADSTLDNALSESGQFGMSKAQAQAEVAAVARACARWKEHFRKAAVAERDIEYLEQFIDRDFLRHQREEYARTAVDNGPPLSRG